jgi:hypothetical protein
MELVPLDVPNGGRQCEYAGINVHDVVMLETPWLCAVVDGSNLAYSSLLLNPTLNPFSTLSHRRINTHNHHCDINDGRKHPIIHRGTSKLTP